jgi:hypothetical protein
MRFGLAIAYFALLILIFLGIGAFSAEKVYEITNQTYHQRIFGFTLELPIDWKVVDEGSVSPNGDYLIELGPDVPDETVLYLSFSPVKGLTLIELVNENILETELGEKISLTGGAIGNVDCYISRQRMNPDKSNAFPDLTNVFARTGDHFMHAIVYSYDQPERERIMKVLDSLHVDKALVEVSFLAVQNRSRYGIPIVAESNTQMYLFAEDPEIRADVSSADGSETFIFDDLTYPARFPEGEHRDLNGYRIQFYGDGRYHVDNRGKRIDVYIPDMNVDVRNFKLSVDMRFEGGHPMKGNGVVFRGGKQGFYLFEISGDCHFALYRYSGGFETIVEKEFSRKIIPYENNHLEIKTNENDISLYINGSCVDKVKVEDNVEDGFVGFYVCAGSWASFDDYCLEVFN